MTNLTHHATLDQLTYVFIGVILQILILYNAQQTIPILAGA